MWAVRYTYNIFIKNWGKMLTKYVVSSLWEPIGFIFGVYMYKQGFSMCVHRNILVPRTLIILREFLILVFLIFGIRNWQCQSRKIHRFLNEKALRKYLTIWNYTFSEEFFTYFKSTPKFHRKLPFLWKPSQNLEYAKVDVYVA